MKKTKSSFDKEEEKALFPLFAKEGSGEIEKGTTESGRPMTAEKCKERGGIMALESSIIEEIVIGKF